MTNRYIIGFVGFIGSGKDTAADYLVNNHGFKRDSFAAALKDSVAHVFGWDRELLEGKTKEARAWRDQVDVWWSNRLNMRITPRWILQYWGTEVCRQGFHDDIWIASLENRLEKTSENIVISDVRFPNEIQAIRNVGGTVIRVRRGAEPVWFDLAAAANAGKPGSQEMFNTYQIHASESAWIGSTLDGVIFNNGTIEELYTRVNSLISTDRALNHQVSIVETSYEEAVDNWHKQS